MILEDERKHHRMLADLADTIRLSAQFSSEPIPIPYLDLHKDREAILAATEQLLQVERQDQRELRRLAKKLKRFKGSPLWGLILRIMQADNAKHRMILRFIKAQTKHYP